ncbi:hypothetical protein [Brevundimonas sp. UBA7664]|uniref:hypothetical protein n=1 Tax=Brevundimonas sp. UBA7664 TaxID=1946141 RepID=UPI0025BAFDEC|nr:hypothetical protein [Brevundimonas sp. UBA7664]
MKAWDWVMAGLCMAWLFALAMLSGIPGGAAADAPAWVQAIGSIAAILVAVGLAGWQHNRSDQLNRRSLRAARFERVAPLRALVDVAAELALAAQANFGWLEEKWEPDFWTRIETELEEVSVMSLGDYTIAKDVLILQRAFSALRWGLGVHYGELQDEMLGEGPPVDPDDLEWFTSRRETIAESAKRISDRLILFEVVE